MFKFLLILFIIFFVLPWILRTTFPWLFRWFVNKQTQRYMDNVNNAYNHSSGQNNRNTPRRPQHKKKIDPTVGEYVEFTEIEGQSSSNKVKPDGPKESQVSDVEWEDLP